MTKSELRPIYLARQTSLLPEERNEKSRLIAGQFFQHFKLDPIKYLHSFIAIDKFNEIDTTLIFSRLWAEFPQITTVVPRVDFDSGEMQHLRFTPATELVKNIWEIHEPSHNEYVETELIETVLVPGLCFDEVGHRVGYGKGFYDRFLSKCREDCIKIGLSFFEPVEKISDTNESDVKLNFCITPETVYTAERGRR